MNPQIGKAAFRIAIFVTGTAAVLLPFQEPGTAEFGVTILTVLIGLAAIGVIAFVVRRSMR
ncbi:MAG: hypothetical protein HY871_04830 [Chloroflexi bacterium]|nr:hypothetical protein [Chloroflexota bacterium]MBI5956306.1 hypothetical protein [Chloroflexota bacterium]